MIIDKSDDVFVSGQFSMMSDETTLEVNLE